MKSVQWFRRRCGTYIDVYKRQDQILERRTQIITLESEKGSTFSKASFASSGIRSDIDIDDPDFWKKWAKKADIDTSESNDKVILFV